MNNWLWSDPSEPLAQGFQEILDKADSDLETLFDSCLDTLYECHRIHEGKPVSGVSDASCLVRHLAEDSRSVSEKEEVFRLDLNDEEEMKKALLFYIRFFGPAKEVVDHLKIKVIPASFVIKYYMNRIHVRLEEGYTQMKCRYDLSKKLPEKNEQSRKALKI